MNTQILAKYRASRNSSRYKEALEELETEIENSGTVLLPIFTIEEVRELSPEVPYEYFAKLEKEWIDSVIMHALEEDD